MPNEMSESYSDGCCVQLPTASCIEVKKEAQSFCHDVSRIWKKVQIKRRVRKMCTLENAKSFLPITIWIRHYKYVYSCK